MPRTARSITAGVCYHVISRTNPGLALLESSADRNALLRLMAAAQERVNLDLLAACLMPNHFHVVVRPADDGDIAGWVHWLLTTHGRRYHKLHGSYGRLWQGRFKAFAIQEDDHLLTVMRYVERNALRAGLVARAEHWGWGSLAWRLNIGSGLRLAESPVTLPADWVGYVNAPQSHEELAELRASVNRQRPYGTVEWVDIATARFGLRSTLGSVGRPRRSNCADETPARK